MAEPIADETSADFGADADDREDELLDEYGDPQVSALAGATWFTSAEAPSET